MSKSYDKDRLDRLYRDHPPVEPSAGLDRIIRAQAEQAIAAKRRVKPLPWMGGLATATVLVLAITVVIQTPEPAAPLPVQESFAPPAMAPATEASGASDPTRSRAAPITEPSRDQVQVTDSRLRSDAATADDQADAKPASLARQTTDGDLSPARSVPAAESTAPSAESDRASALMDTAQRAEARTEETMEDGWHRELEYTSRAQDEPDPWARLEAAIEQGETDRASALLDALRQQFPDDDRLERFEQRIDALEPRP